MSFYRRRYYFHCFYFYLLVIFDNFCCFSHVTYAVARNTCVLKCGQSSDFFGNVSAFTLIYTDTLVASINTKTIIFSLSEIYRVQRKGFCSQHPEWIVTPFQSGFFLLLSRHSDTAKITIHWRMDDISK